MKIGDEASWFAKLDPQAQTKLREALTAQAAGTEFYKVVGEAWRLVAKARSFGSERLSEPLALPLDTKVNDAQTLDELTFTPEELAFERIVVSHNLRNDRPERNSEYRKLLGIDPGGVLQQPVRWTFGAGGPQADVPLWFALRALGADNSGVNGVLYGLAPGAAAPPGEFRAPRLLDRLPVADALRAHVAYELITRLSPPPPSISGIMSVEKERRPLALFARIKALSDSEAEALVPWAHSELDRLAVPSRTSQPAIVPLLLASSVMLRARQPFKPEWDWLIPVSGLLSDELLASLPADRRLQRMVTETQQNVFASYAVGEALALLKKYPEQALLDAAWARFPDADMTTTAFGKAFKEALAGNDALLRIVAEKVAAFPKPIKLVCVESSEPKDVAALSDMQKKQLRLAGKMYDDADLPAEKRLADPNEETTLSLTLRTFANPKGSALYDALLYNGDSGTVFRHQTLEVVAQILQGSLECDDPMLLDALKPLVRSKVKVAVVKLAESKRTTGA